MSKIKYILTIISIILLFESCSFLTKVTSLEIKKSKGWTEGDICQSCSSVVGYMMYYYKYKTANNDSFSISICPCLYYHSVSFGPPAIPFIPIIRRSSYFEWEKHPFFIDIEFKNFKGKTIDINSLQYTVNKSNTNISPISIELLPYKKSHSKRDNYSPQTKIDTVFLTEQKFYVNNDTIQIRIHFNLLRNKTKQFSINFENFTVDDNTVQFPILNLKRKRRFLYDPLVIGH